MSQTLTMPQKRTRAKRIELSEALIFGIPIGQALDNPLDPQMSDCSCSLITPDNLRRFFADPAMLAEFARFLEHGFVGMCVHQENQWVSVMWMTLPSTRQALHMPASTRGHYWIFSTRTHQAFRSRGYAKVAMKALAMALDLGDRREQYFYADVDPKNEASRRALLGYGFEPMGRMRTFSVPKLKLFWGSWRPALPHPPLTSK